uniref:Uncharacterized protein n=1 Tax=Rhizophagus irregularis (strain DAOM 181602 / DAOM 197198 / MUCL 43194) TaxID=747089 RepID=U9UB39_RHIID
MITWVDFFKFYDLFKVKVPARYCVLGMYLITENYEIMISNTSRSALIPGFCLLRICRLKKFLKRRHHYEIQSGKFSRVLYQDTVPNFRTNYQPFHIGIGSKTMPSSLYLWYTERSLDPTTCALKYAGYRTAVSEIHERIERI